MQDLNSSRTKLRGWIPSAGLIAALLTMAALLACGGGSSSSTSTDTTTLKTITITPSSATLNVNQSANFIATALDSNGNAVSNLTYTWTSSAQNVAIVTNSGLVTGLAAGSTQITASVTTVAATSTTPATVVTSNTAAVTVIPPIASVAISPVSAQIAKGQTQQFTAKVLDANGNTIPGVIVTWSDSNAAVVSIDANGLATGLAPGTVTIVAHAGSSNIQSNLAQLTVTQ
jgi:uncharacterized protein YjdB